MVSRVAGWPLVLSLASLIAGGVALGAEGHRLVAHADAEPGAALAEGREGSGSLASEEAMEGHSTPGRRRSVGTSPTIWEGSVVVHLKMTVEPENRPIVEDGRAELEAEGMTVTDDGIEFPSKPGIGYWIFVGDQRAMSDFAGRFTITAPSAPVATGEIVSSNGGYRATFSVAEHLGAEGADVRPIDVRYLMRDRPNEMNRLHVPPPAPPSPTPGPNLSEPSAHGEPDDHRHHGHASPGGDLEAHLFCPSSSACSPAPCRQGICCLDYDGWCKDAPLKRWNDCALRYTQFVKSTCWWWVWYHSCCINEGAITDNEGPGCVDNHRGRECQTLDPTFLGLQLTTGEVTNYIPPDPRTADLMDNWTNERVTVRCGQSIQIQLHNNTCANESNVTFNEHFAGCKAGGLLDRVGTIPHYLQTKMVTDNSEEGSSYRHIKDVSLIYIAPETIPCATATDVVTVRAGGRMRRVTIDVVCTPGADPPRAATPYFDKPAGIYPEPSVTVIVTLPGGETGDIHYTLDGTNPTLFSPKIASGAAIQITETRTLKARTYRSGANPSFIWSADYHIWKKLRMPTVSPDGGLFPAGPIDVRITCTDAFATCYYTLDGSTPTQASPLSFQQQTTISINGNTTLKARAFKPLTFDSDIKISEFRFGQLQKAAAPTLSPPPGPYAAPIQVFAVSATAGATVHYTTDGSDPDASSPSALPITVDRSLTIRAQAFHSGFAPSDVTTGVYELRAAAPTFSPPGGTYAAPQSVMMQSQSPGVTIHYSTDGSDPTESHPTAQPVNVNQSTTIRARAFRTGWTPSPISTATYQIVSCVPSGSWAAQFTVASDPGGHAPFIGLSNATLTVQTSGTTVTIRGNHAHTVNTAGTISGCMIALSSGSGTVAGFPNVRCEYRNVSIQGNTMTGTYVLGVNGELPGGQPISYTFTATR